MPILSFDARTLLDSPDLPKAIQALRDEGIVVLENAVDTEHIGTLRDRWLADIPLLMARPDKPFNWNPGNMQQDPPPFAPYLFRDLLVNDAAIAITHAILGDGVKNAFYSGNTAMPSEHRQPVHADMGNLWPNLEHAHPAYAIVVNAPLVDMSVANGSTEMWPGTHKDTSVVHQSGDIKVSPEKQEERRKVEGPVQPTVKAGSLVLRDIRMWHAGMPNRTDQPRPMLAMIHWVSWFPTAPLKFPKGTESYFDHPILKWQIDFTDDKIDHIAAPGAYEYAETK